MRDLEHAGALIFIPAIADDEVRRGLLFARASAGLGRLDYLVAGPAFVPVSTVALKLAAELWAQLQRAGLPTVGRSRSTRIASSPPRRSNSAARATA
jgi:hypothetical protein